MRGAGEVTQGPVSGLLAGKRWKEAGGTLLCRAVGSVPGPPRRSSQLRRWPGMFCPAAEHAEQSSGETTAIFQARADQPSATLRKLCVTIYKEAGGGVRWPRPRALRQPWP